MFLSRAFQAGRSGGGGVGVLSMGADGSGPGGGRRGGGGGAISGASAGGASRGGGLGAGIGSGATGASGVSPGGAARFRQRRARQS